MTTYEQLAYMKPEDARRLHEEMAAEAQDPRTRAQSWARRLARNFRSAPYDFHVHFVLEDEHHRLTHDFMVEELGVFCDLRPEKQLQATIGSAALYGYGEFDDDNQLIMAWYSGAELATATSQSAEA